MRDTMEEKRPAREGALRQVVLFYLLAFGFSWLGWVPQALHARGLFPFDSPILAVLGGAGPTLAAVVVLLWSKDREGLRDLFARLGRVRAAGGWYVVAVGLWPLIVAVAVALGSVLGAVTPEFEWMSWARVAPVFVAMLFAAVWEETGWRGFVLPRLQGRWPSIMIALAMGVLGWLWHLPLMLNPESPMSKLPWSGELVFSIALAALSLWLFQRTAGSLFFVSIFHAMANTVAFVLQEAGVYVSSFPFVAGVSALAALAVMLIPGLLDPEGRRA